MCIVRYLPFVSWLIELVGKRVWDVVEEDKKDGCVMKLIVAE